MLSLLRLIILLPLFTFAKVVKLPAIYRLDIGTKLNGSITFKPDGERSVIQAILPDGVPLDSYLFILGNGNFTFENIDFVIKDNQYIDKIACVGTVQTNQNATYKITFKNCSFIGDWRYNLQSSAGKGTVTFTDCNLNSQHNNIQFYSQAGSKTLKLTRCTIGSDSSHAIYAHNNNNFYFDSVVVVKQGIRTYADGTTNNELGMNTYQTTKDLPGRAIHQTFNRCFNADNCPNVMWRLASNYTTIKVTNCSFPVYEWRGNFNLKNCKLWNAGNGAVVPNNPLIDSCTGEIWITGKAKISNSNFKILRLIETKNVQINNTKIDWFWNTNSTYIFNNSTYENEIK